MFTLLAGERNTSKAARVNHTPKVEIQNGSGTWIDWTAYVGRLTWGEQRDQGVATGQLTLLRENGGSASLAPLMTGSSLNVDDHSVYSPAIDLARLIRISTATHAPEHAVISADYREVFIGRIGAVAWESDPIVVEFSDLGAFLMDTQIEVLNRQYGSFDASVQLETALQQILNDTPSFPTPITLYTPVASTWFPLVFTQDRVKLLEALRTKAQDIGWDLRYRYDSAGVCRLTLMDPDRTRVTVDTTIDGSEYVDVRQLSLKLDNVRNAGTIPYVDNTGTHYASQIDANSIAKYQRRFFQLDGVGAINTSTEAQRLIDAVVHDLAGAPAEQQIECPYLWFVQLYDRYTFSANGHHYDTDQTMSVVAYQHTFENGEGVTTIDTAGRVIGAYSAWLKRGAASLEGESSPPTATLSLNDFKWTDSADGLTRTFSMVAGDNVYRVAVYVNPMLAPPQTDPWPSDSVVPSAPLLTPAATTRLVTFTVAKPSAAFQTFIQFEPRMLPDMGVGGPVRRHVLDPAPSAQTATLHGAVTNATVDLSADVQAGLSDWPVTVDFFADTPFGGALATKLVNANSTLDKLTSGLAALGGLSLPQRAARRFFVRTTNVAGEVKWGEPIAVDRDSLPYAYVTLNDYRPAPVIKVNYDDDTDVVKFYLPGGLTKTFSGLSGGGTVSYTVGDAPDVGSPENALAIDESRTGYQVDVQGGGTFLTVWGGVLQGTVHGLTTGPSLVVTPTPGAISYDIAYSGTGVITLSIDGGAYGTPPASPILAIARGATVDKLYAFKSVQAGQTIIDTVTIPSLEKDTVTPDLTLTPGTPTNTVQPYTITAANPSGGAAPTITVTPFNCTMVILGVTYSTAQVVPTGTVVTVNRPSTVTDTQAHLTVVAVLAGGGTEAIDVSIVSQLNFGPVLNVQATPGTTPTGDYSIVWSGTGTITWSVNGAAYTTPSASPVPVARDATLDKTYSFKCNKDGQDIVDTVVVPSLQSDSVTPDLVVVAGTPTNIAQVYTVTFSNPRSGGASVAGTVQLYGPVASFNINGGTNWNEGDGAKSFSSGDVISVNRPVSTTNTVAHIRFRAAISGGGSEEIKLPVFPSLNLGPTLVVTPTPGDTSYSLAWSGTGTITVAIDGAGYVTPGTSPISVSRTLHDIQYAFKAVLDGQTISTTVTVPATLPAPSAAVSVTAVATSSPCDGGGNATVSWTTVGLPDGCTFDVTLTIKSGTYNGNQVSHVGVSSGDSLVGAFCPGQSARATVIVRFGGDILATGFVDFTS